MPITQVNRNTTDGRGATAIAREVSKEGLSCTAEDAKQWIDSFYNEFQVTANFIDSCKQAVFNPGYVVNPWGRYRTAGDVSKADDDVVAALQRQFVNFP